MLCHVGRPAPIPPLNVMSRRSSLTDSIAKLCDALLSVTRTPFSSVTLPMASLLMLCLRAVQLQLSSGIMRPARDCPWDDLHGTTRCAPCECTHMKILHTHVKDTPTACRSWMEYGDIHFLKNVSNNKSSSSRSKRCYTINVFFM